MENNDKKAGEVLEKCGIKERIVTGLSKTRKYQELCSCLQEFLQEGRSWRGLIGVDSLTKQEDGWNEGWDGDQEKVRGFGMEIRESFFP